MRTYLVTGGAGFIGSNYIHYMFRKYDNEIRIINVDALTYAGNLENLKDIENRDNYTFVKANICDKEAIAKIFAENEHCIGHLFFQWQDQANCWQCGEPDCPSECAWGCIRTDGTPKPGYYALAEEYNKYFG